MALTRARGFLYIIDTQEGEKNLWHYFEKDSLHKAYQSLASDVATDWPIEKMGHVLLAGKEQAVELVDREPLAKAEELSRKGKRYQNSEYLRRASYHYREAGEFLQAKRCLAEAHTIEGDWKNAAEFWQDLEEYEKASDSLYQGRFWEELWALHREFPGLADAFRSNVARFMSAAHADLDLALETVLHPKTLQGLLPRDPVFGSVIQNLLRVLPKARAQNRRDWIGTAELLEKIVEKGFESRALILEIANYYFAGQNWNRAAEHWEAIRVQSENYYWAKYLASDLPEEQIRWLVKLPCKATFQDKSARECLTEAWKKADPANPYLFDRTAYFYYKDEQWQTTIHYWQRWHKKSLPSGTNREERFYPREYYLACYNVSENPVDRIKAILSIEEEDRIEEDLKRIKAEWDKIKHDESLLGEM